MSNSIKVWHVNSSDLDGGAARAAFRIHTSLLVRFRVSDSFSRMRVVSKMSDHNSVVGGYPIGSNFFIQSLRYRLIKYSRLNFRSDVYSVHSNPVLPTGLGREIGSLYSANKCNVVNLHWLGDSTLSINEVSSLKVPIVWTLHDQWLFSGSGHYIQDSPIMDTRFANGYYSYNRPHFERGFDLQRHIWLKKMIHLRPKLENNCHIVAPSNWLANSARSSLLLKNCKVSVIPHPIDLKIWRPIEKIYARKILSLSSEKYYILFGASSGFSDIRKGGDLLIDALHKFISNSPRSLSSKTELLFFGKGEPPNLPLPVHSFGHLFDDISLNVLYSAADLMVVPSRIEAFGLTAAEAQACGTPVVAFNLGGLSDIVCDKVTGRLAVPFDSSSLSNGITWVLNQLLDSTKLQFQSRNRAESLWSSSTIARSYERIYEELICSE